MAAALSPIKPNEKLETINLRFGLTFRKILDQYKAQAPTEIPLANRIELNLTELLKITAGGLDLMDILASQERLSKSDYMRLLKKHLTVSDEDGDIVILTVNSLAYYYCNVEISLTKNEVIVEENCD